ncbi:hypothetical protein HGA88_06785 [Candidatus Roizmanbacteria bacterium]|nr:hypothetical protein [Candidatus Roizmanbacteria bacterium]
MEKTKNQLQPVFVPDYNTQSNRIYANYVTVANTGIDFTLTFLDVAPPSEEQVNLAKENKPIPTPVQCQVVLPSHIIQSLIEALNTQNELVQTKNEK